MAMLGAAVRFVHFALFEGTLLSPASYLADTLYLVIVGALAWRMTRAAQMATQYYWLYERTGPLTWRSRSAGEEIPGAKPTDHRVTSRQKPDKMTPIQITRGRGDHEVRGPQLEENGMKTMWLAGVALGASLALGRRGVGPGHHHRRRRTDDRPVRLVRHPAQERRRSRGRRHQRRRRRDGQEAQARDRRRRLRSEAGPRGRREVRQHEGAVRRRALLLVVLDPGVGGLPGRRRAADHAGLDQPDLHRPQHVEHVPRLRPRRPAGQRRRRLRRQELQGQERRHPSRQVDLRQRPGRRDEEGAQQGRRQGEDVRGLHAGRQGLQLARLEDEGQQDRRRLCRRLPHRGGPDPAPDARPGHDEPDDLRRRDRHERVLVDHRTRPAKA